MKKKLKIITIIIILGFFCFMAFSIYKQVKRKEQIAEKIKNIPEFYFYMPGSDSIFTDANIKADKATLIIYYNPECEHCQYEADIISKRIEEFKPFQLFFITYANAEQIESFAHNYKLTGFANIKFLWDKEFIFSDVFGESKVPVSFIYDKEGKLVKKIIGEIKVDALLKFLKD